MFSELTRSLTLGGLALAFSLLPMAPGAAADEAAVEKTARALPDDILRQFSNGKGAFLKRISQQLFSIAPDGVVTRDALDLMMKQTVAAARARIIAELLTHDLDGDGALSVDEIGRIQSGGAAQKRLRPRLAVYLLQDDTDGDGALSFAEILALASKDVKRQRLGRVATQGEMFMAFDVNGDGMVDLAEIDRVADAAIRLKLTPRRTRTDTRTGRACVLPKVPTGVETVLVSAYEGAALSNIAIAGHDRATHVAKLTIEKGEAPLFLVVGAHTSTIWHLQGATDRIWKIAVQSHRNAGAGVAGLAKDKVIFIEEPICFNRFKSAGDGMARIAKSTISAATGKPVNAVLAAYSVGEMTVPSGTAHNTDIGGAPYRTPLDITAGGKTYRLSAAGMAVIGEDGTAAALPKDRRTIRALMRFHPNGVRTLDPASVVANGPVNIYDVLPGEAGLLQLLADGALTVTSDGYYLINAAISHFPAGLAGAHSVRFILGKGVPLPGGKPGHSSVIDEATGECRIGRCR